MNWRNWVLPGAALALAGAAGVALIPHWVFPPIRSTDYGPAAMDQVVFKDSRAPLPPGQPEVMPASYGGPAAGAVYKNVTVLGGVSKGEFDRTMVAITKWVSPGQGCGFCHATGQPYSADNPRKQIARQMLAMTRTVNANWTNHVGAQGVTCYSCHAGKNVPDNRWHIDKPDEPIEGGLVGKPQEWNTQAKTIRNFFPSKPNRLFLLEGQPAGAVESEEALARTGPRTNWQHDRTYTEHVYVFMMQMANGIGTNCTYCHGARDFNWAESPPNRLNGYSGIVMTRMINQNYIAPLAAYTEPQLRGAMGDAGKADCKTCHQGQEKPVGGMQHYVYPALIGPLPAAGRAANVLAAANPGIPLLSRQPQVGVPSSDTVVQFKGERQP